MEVGSENCLNSHQAYATNSTTPTCRNLIKKKTKEMNPILVSEVNDLLEVFKTEGKQNPNFKEPKFEVSKLKFFFGNVGSMTPSCIDPEGNFFLHNFLMQA